MKNNTEDLGSIFDAQPSLLKGNIHNIADANETVVGYLSVGTTQTKRIFIDRANLPPTWRTLNSQACELDTAFYNDPLTRFNDVKLTLINIIPPGFLAVDSIGTLGYSRTTRTCGDCTLRGVNKQPAFWKWSKRKRVYIFTKLAAYNLRFNSSTSFYYYEKDLDILFTDFNLA